MNSASDRIFIPEKGGSGGGGKSSLYLEAPFGEDFFPFFLPLLYTIYGLRACFAIFPAISFVKEERMML